MDFRNACNAQLQRPLWRLQQANYGGCVFAVSAFAFAHMYTLNSRRRLLDARRHTLVRP
jgi:hypothetical protein